MEKEIACKSVLIKGIIDDDAETDEAIPLPQVKKETLDKVLDYCKHIVKNEAPVLPKPLEDNKLPVDAWFVEYVNIDQEKLFELILAANFLDIRSLLELACAKVAVTIKGMKIEDVRKYFNI